ncbi:MAG: beta-ketoacyl-[acyl-carrier-protein] synthase family protein [Phycisphaerales bacterium]
MPHLPPEQRVVITGTGWTTPLGNSVDSVWAKLIAGVSAIGPITRFPAARFSTNFAAEVPPFELEHFIAEHEPHADAHLNARYALAAATHAWKQSGLGDISRAGQRNAGYPSLDPERVGIYLGAGEGVFDFENYTASNIAAWNPERGRVDDDAWWEHASKALTATSELQQEPNMVLRHLATALGARGPAYNSLTACAASTQAVGEALELIRRGDADVMIAGGAHTMIHPLGVTGFIRLTALSGRRDDPATASRPFDRTRDGFVMGEGAGIVIIERLSHALARGATPLAELVGYGSSADAYRITDIQPEGKGAQAAMREALDDAGIDPHATDAQGRPLIHYISAHGTGTKENDSIETKAVKAVFGEHAPNIPMSSIKSMMGHLIAAAGSVELITCVQAIRTGFLPPTLNLNTPDPDLDLDYVPNAARDLRERGGVHTALSNNFGFGGQNDTLVVARYTP